MKINMYTKRLALIILIFIWLLTITGWDLILWAMYGTDFVLSSRFIEAGFHIAQFGVPSIVVAFLFFRGGLSLARRRCWLRVAIGIIVSSAAVILPVVPMLAVFILGRLDRIANMPTGIVILFGIIEGVAFTSKGLVWFAWWRFRRLLFAGSVASHNSRSGDQPA